MDTIIIGMIGMDCLRAQPGLLSHLARELKITRAAVAKWRRIPAERVLAVEKITGISRHYLRPDLYPAPMSDGEHRLAAQRRRATANSTRIGA